MCLVFLSIAAIVTLSAAQQAAAGQYSCPYFTDPTGNMYGLNGLANGGEGYVLETNGFVYRFAICEVLNGRYKVNYCNATNTAVCQFPQKNSGPAEPVGVQIAAGSTNPAGQFQQLQNAEGMTWMMTQPSTTCPGNQITTQIDFICDHNNEFFSMPGFNFNDLAASYPKFALVSASTCSYHFTATTHHACKRNHCAFFKNTYGTIDLNPLRSSTGYSVQGYTSVGNYNYTVSPCGSLLPINNPAGGTWCAEPGSFACERWNGPAGAMNWKTIGLSQLVTVQPTDNSNTPKGLILTATGGTHSFNCGAQHQTQLTITCSPSASVPVLTFGGVNEATCISSFSMVSSAACIVPTNGPGIIIGGHYLSGGSVFLILFFICLFLYVSLGCVYNYVRNKKRGLEMLPNREFWAMIPGLVMDGIRFCTCRGKKTTTAYDAM